MAKDKTEQVHEEQMQGKGETYRLPGVQAEDGSTGTLVFTVKPGGNAHAEFEADAGGVPSAGQLPADPTPEGQPAAPEQQPVQAADPGQQPSSPPGQPPVDPPAAGEPTVTGEPGQGATGAQDPGSPPPEQ